MVCDQTSKIQALHDAALTPAEAQALQAHLSTCTICALELQRLQRLANFLRAAAITTPDAAALARIRNKAIGVIQARNNNRRAFRLAQWLSAAAALVIMVCGFSLYTSRHTLPSAARTVPIWSNVAVSPSSELAAYSETEDPMLFAISDPRELIRD